MSTAYLNGMSEYYEMDKNEFNIMQMWFFLGYLIGGFPSKFLLGGHNNKISVRFYLGSLEMLWSLATMSMCFCNDIHQIYFVRFLVGFLEAGFFPSMVYLIGTYYDKAEINKRQALFNISGTVGTMITGPLQQLILNKNWDFGGSLQKFQVLFFLDACISLPIAAYTMCVNPGLPNENLQLNKIFYFNEQDHEIATRRLASTFDKSSASSSSPTRGTRNWIVDFFGSWHCIVFPLLFASIRNASYAAEPIVSTSWIKNDLKLPSEYYNYFPSLLSFCAILLTLFVSVLNDNREGRFTVKLIYVFFVIYATCAGLLVYWNIPDMIHWLCYLLFGALTYASPVVLVWINRSLQFDNSRRHFIVVLTNSFDYLVYAFYPVWAWDQRDQPKYHKGFVMTVVLSVFGFILTKVADVLTKRDKKADTAPAAAPLAEVIDEETALLSHE